MSVVLALRKHLFRGLLEDHGELAAGEQVQVCLVDENTLQTLVASLEKTSLQTEILAEDFLDDIIFLFL